VSEGTRIPDRRDHNPYQRVRVRRIPRYQGDLSCSEARVVALGIVPAVDPHHLTVDDVRVISDDIAQRVEQLVDEFDRVAT
jgi:hypothetical protein